MKDFLTKREKDNLRKAAHRMEEAFKSLKERKVEPDNRLEAEIHLRILGATKTLMEIGYLVGVHESGEHLKPRIDIVKG